MSITKDPYRQRAANLLTQLQDLFDFSAIKSKYFQSIKDNEIDYFQVLKYACEMALYDASVKPKSAVALLKLIKYTIETWNQEWIVFVQDQILPHYVRICQVEGDPKSGTRGSIFFKNRTSSAIRLSETDDENIEKLGKSLHALCLESIWVWSQWFSAYPTYAHAYAHLARSGVDFPVQFMHFDQIDLLTKNILDVVEQSARDSQYYYPNNEIYFQCFDIQKRGKTFGSLVSRKIAFVEDKIYQVEQNQAGKVTKHIQFPNQFVFESLNTYDPKSATGTTLPWEGEYRRLYVYRIVCQRSEKNMKNMSFAIYFQNVLEATKVRDYMQFIRTKKTIDVKPIFQICALIHKNCMARRFYDLIVQKCALVSLSPVRAKQSSFDVFNAAQNQHQQNINMMLLREEFESTQSRIISSADLH